MAPVVLLGFWQFPFGSTQFVCLDGSFTDKESDAHGQLSYKM